MVFDYVPSVGYFFRAPSVKQFKKYLDNKYGKKVIRKWEAYSEGKKVWGLNVGGINQEDYEQAINNLEEAVENYERDLD